MKTETERSSGRFRRDQAGLFYTSLGHFPESFENVLYLGHLFGGLSWPLDAKLARCLSSAQHGW